MITNVTFRVNFKVIESRLTYNHKENAINRKSIINTYVKVYFKITIVNNEQFSKKDVSSNFSSTRSSYVYFKEL